MLNEKLKKSIVSLTATINEIREDITSTIWKFVETET